MRFDNPDSRNHRLTMRLSPYELAWVVQQSNALNISTSEFVRKRALGRRLVIKQTRQWEPSVVLAVSRIGNNVNQIAKALHEGFPVSAQEVRNMLAQIEDMVLKAMNQDDRKF